MRKLIVTELVSVDGVMEAPGGEPNYPHTGWAIDYMGPEQIDFKMHETLEAESLLIGRITYESFLEGWSEQTGEFADKMNFMPKQVVSTTLKNPEWNNSTVISGDVIDEIKRVKRSDGGSILVAGSRTLVHTLMHNDLVDEYRFMIFPVILGSGLRVFPESPNKTVLQLTDTRSFANGVVSQTYQPSRE